MLTNVANGKNIHTLQMRPENASFFAPILEKYELLKDTVAIAERGAYYDRQKDLWVTKRKHIEPQYSSSLQLLNVLIEFETNPDFAKSLYIKLKDSALYSKTYSCWNSFMDKDEKFRECKQTSSGQLLGVLAEIEYDPKNAKKFYQWLKRSSFFNKTIGQWNSDQDITSSNISIASELLSDLIEIKLYPVGGQDSYSWFKDSSHHYNNGLWHETRLTPTLVFYTFHQMLGLLCEVEIDPVSAQSQYNKLKNSMIFNKTDDIWYSSFLNDYDRDNGLDNLGKGQDGFSMSCQLLAILLELKLIKKSANDFNQNIEASPLPKIRSF